MPIIGLTKTDPWQVDVDLAKRHVLFNKLQGKRLNFGQLAGFLDSINNDFWDEVRNVVPDEWHSDDFDDIVAHISAIRSNEAEFIRQIKVVLQ